MEGGDAHGLGDHAKERGSTRSFRDVALPRLLVACHDAGGAEIVSAWVRRHRDKWSVTYCLAGPADEIFKRKLGPDLRRSDLFVQDHREAKLILCGSSKASDVERSSIELARIYGVRSAVYLDHWTNYRERFVLPSGRLQLPDEVWVADEHACRLACAALPGVKVLLRGNPYLEDTVAEIASHAVARSDDRERVLVVGEPEYDTVAATRDPRWSEKVLRIRPHPSWATSVRSLAEDIAWADTVVGWDSMALVVALKAGRRVVSLLPVSESHLPFPEIERPPG